MTRFDPNLKDRLVIRVIVLATICCGLLTLQLSANGIGNNEATNKVSQASNCTSLVSRIKRLACFDQIFSTPMSVLTHERVAQARPTTWLRAYNNEVQRNQRSEIFLINQHDNSDLNADIWLTARSNQLSAEFPVLMLSCIDEISRVELLFEEPVLHRKKVKVTIKNENNEWKTNSIEQIWLFDETGTVLRAGRGLTSISTMKQLMANNKSQLSLDLAKYAQLSFNTETLQVLVKPMRKRCRW